MWMRNVPLAELTRWRIGGPAPAFARARTEEELRALLAEAPDGPLMVLGRGANLLIADEGADGPVVVLNGDFKSFELTEGGLRFGAAALISAVVQTARRNARAGLWILEAVPGTMGGALRMNAGTAEEGIWERVVWTDVMWRDGRLDRIRREDVKPRYRAVDVDPSGIFLRGEINAPPGDKVRIEEEHSRRREAKLAAQVYDQPSCGSTWKNPAAPAPTAWQLVDRVGMRGERRGGAQISTKHANFIVNLGNARAKDVVELMLETRRRVSSETGIALEPEIQFWGFSRDVLVELGAAG
jgi:UDP-N-acetylmuramate dehydrogenase